MNFSPLSLSQAPFFNPNEDFKPESELHSTAEQAPLRLNENIISLTMQNFNYVDLIQLESSVYSRCLQDQLSKVKFRDTWSQNQILTYLDSSEFQKGMPESIKAMIKQIMLQPANTQGDLRDHMMCTCVRAAENDPQLLRKIAIELSHDFEWVNSLMKHTTRKEITGFSKGVRNILDLSLYRIDVWLNNPEHRSHSTLGVIEVIHEVMKRPLDEQDEMLEKLVPICIQAGYESEDLEFVTTIVDKLFPEMESEGPATAWFETRSDIEFCFPINKKAEIPFYRELEQHLQRHERAGTRTVWQEYQDLKLRIDIEDSLEWLPKPLSWLDEPSPLNRSALSD